MTEQHPHPLTLLCRNISYKTRPLGFTPSKEDFMIHRISEDTIYTLRTLIFPLWGDHREYLKASQVSLCMIWWIYPFDEWQKNLCPQALWWWIERVQMQVICLYCNRRKIPNTSTMKAYVTPMELGNLLALCSNCCGDDMTKLWIIWHNAIYRCMAGPTGTTKLHLVYPPYIVCRHC